MADRDAGERPLPDAATERLERFAGRLERLTIDILPTFASEPLDPRTHARAVDIADRAAAEHGLGEAIETARRMMLDWVARLYSSQQSFPEWAGTARGRSTGTAHDRAVIATTLGDAVTALVLWDELDGAERDELLGPWVDVAS